MKRGVVMYNRRAQGLPISTIIIAALGILVLVVIGAIFGGQIGKFGRAASECPGRCYKANIPTDPPGFSALYQSEKCDTEYETRLSGSFSPRNMIKTDKPPSLFTCDSCCITTG